MNKNLIIFLIIGVSHLCCLNTHADKNDELGKTPQMGWNSWNKFSCNINEKLIRETADAMVKHGMKDAGYEYVNIDDCWHGERDAMGFIHPNKKRFPSGMKALADYVHAQGLKLGIYSDAGATTCAGYPGSLNHEAQDARTYASWGIDYVKYDWCDTEGLHAQVAYTTMRDAIKKTGRPMLFSICEWGENKPWLWAKEVGHSWRTTGDIYPCWNCEFRNYALSKQNILRILDQQEGLRQYAGPGHWNDMDMLEVGNGMNHNEDRAHFSLWAMLASPLITGNDIRSMSETTRAILTNKEVIAISQDPLGVQALRIFSAGALEIWIKPLINNEWALLLLNRGDQLLAHTYQWSPLRDEFSNRAVDFNKTQYQWADVWTKAVGTTQQPLSTEIAAHSVLMLRLKPKVALKAEKVN
jgi:alpha-galactosidase